MAVLYVLTVFVIAYFTFDYFGPKEIPLRPVKVFGLNGFGANDLMVQEYDNAGNLWATRGMTIYKLAKGDQIFTRIAHVPVGFSLFWILNFSLVRRLAQRYECLEIVMSAYGEVCAFAAGYMIYGNVYNRKFERKMKLPHFGIGIGRGMLSNGLLKVDNRHLFFGEYFRNENRTKVQVFRSDNFGQQWEMVYEFSDKTIRHIHALQKDPYTGNLWICTGDLDSESMIGWTDDHFKSIHFIGSGTQTWRACQLTFTEKAVYWGTDTDSELLGGIYRWDKKSKEITKLLKVNGAVFFATRLEKGSIIMSTDREGFKNETDDRTRLYVITPQNNIRVIMCGTWQQKGNGIRFGFAKTRFQRNQGSSDLAMNFLNQKEVSGGDLYLIAESEFFGSSSTEVRTRVMEHSGQCFS
jgi:hypothetical protein